MEDIKNMDRQITKRKKLYSLLGDLPDRNRKISCKKIDEIDYEKYILEKLVLDINGIESVPAFFVKPKNIKSPTPVILYNHAHGADYQRGKEELIHGTDYLSKPPYIEVLTKLGFSVLCIDHWGFGERRGRTEPEIFKYMLWHGKVMWGMMVYDSIKAIDYLVSRNDVNASCIGTIGISMGSTMAWWVAALDTRIKVCIDICCLTDFHSLIESRGLDSHGIYYYVPNLLKYFDTAQINGLIAPRAHLSLAGNYDLLTPTKGLDKIDSELKRVYRHYKRPEAWKLLRYEVGHLETAEMRKEVINFLKRYKG